MAFYLSPLVDVQEIDLSTTIPAVATSIGVITLRNTKKGQEMTRYLVSTEDELVRAFGRPTNNPACYKDMLAAAGYLKYGNKLYCTRVLPADATFAGFQLDGTSQLTQFQAPYLWETVDGNLTLTDNTSASPQAYTLQPLGNPDDIGYTDMSKFHEAVQPSGADFMWVFADSRGDWGNNIRMAIINRDTQKLINDNEAYSQALSGWFPWTLNDEGNPVLRGDWIGATVDIGPNPNTLNPAEQIYTAVAEIDITLQSDNEALFVIQTRSSETDDWDTVETHRISTIEGAINENGFPMFIETYINEVSQYIKVSLNPAETNNSWESSFPEFIYLTGGYDGTPYEWLDGAGKVGKDPQSGIEFGLLRESLDLYSNPEEIDVNILIDADKPMNYKRYMIEFCEKRKDCMAILDCPQELVVDNRGKETVALTDWRRATGVYAGPKAGEDLNQNTSYAAVYGNWLEIYDKYNNKYRWLPPAGHVAGIYAHTDDVNDPWWAPAGLNRAILTGIRRLAWNPNLGHRDLLYKNGINPIVSFAGQGKVIWGQKTLLDKPSSFNRVNVRRLFIVLEKAISTAAKYFLFEPNDEITRRQLKSMIEPFLRDVRARRGIYEYKVICDETNNTPERIDRNELWCTILIKATRVAEFIVLQFVSLKTGASFEEAAAQVNPKV